MGLLIGDILPFEDNITLSWFQNPRNAVKQGRLARAVGSDQSQQFSFIDMQVHAFQGDQLIKIFLEGLCFDDLHGQSSYLVNFGVSFPVTALKNQSHRLIAPLPIDSQGSAFIAGRLQPEFDLENSVAEIRFGELQISQARVRLVGPVDKFAVDFDGTVSSEQLTGISLEGTGTGSFEGIDEFSVTARSNVANVLAEGSIAWLPDFSVKAKVNTADIDPSTFGPFPAGALDAAVIIEATSVDAFSATVSSLSGTWNDYPVDASGTLMRDGTTWRCATCTARVGENNASIDGVLTDKAASASWDVEADSLEQFWPELHGSLSGRGRIRGPRTLPILSGDFTGENLGAAGWQIASVAVESFASTTENSSVSAKIAGLARDNTTFGDFRLRVQGVAEAPTVDAEWKLSDFSAATRLFRMASSTDSTIPWKKGSM